MEKISSKDLLHHRLQAWLGEHTCEDISYIGEKKSFKSGEMEHFYRIGEHEVPVDAIESFEMEEVEGDEIT